MGKTETRPGQNTDAMQFFKLKVGIFSHEYLKSCGYIARMKSPPLSFSKGLYAQLISKSGAGADPIDLPMPIDFPTADDTRWSVGVFGTLPLYAGGANRAEKMRAQEELYQLQIERNAVAYRVEQRIRSALLLAGASFYSIELAQAAADAALESLELVTESYVSGAVSIVELLDAQAAALRASEEGSNAVYDFLIDLMEVDRSMSSFGFHQTEPERQAFYRSVHDYMVGRGVQPLPQDQATGSFTR